MIRHRDEHHDQSHPAACLDSAPLPGRCRLRQHNERRWIPIFYSGGYTQIGDQLQLVSAGQLNQLAAHFYNEGAVQNVSGGGDIGVNFLDPPTIGSSDHNFFIANDGSAFAQFSIYMGIDNVYFQLNAAPATLALAGGSLIVLAFFRQVLSARNCAESRGLGCSEAPGFSVARNPQPIREPGARNLPIAHNRVF